MRLKDALMGQRAFARGTTAEVADLRLGGMNGFSQAHAEWVSHQQYIRKNVFCLLVQAPLGFQYLPDGEIWTGTLKALVENQALAITGLKGGLKVDTTEIDVGGAGQKQQDVTNVTEEQPQVSFKLNDKYNLPVYRFLDGWIRNLIMDPNTKFANINTFPGAKKAKDMLADMYAATMIFIEPDPTHTHVIKAWLGVNMYPLSSGELVGSRDLTQASEASTYDIEMAGLYTSNLGVYALAQKLLDSINISGANPQMRKSFVESISAEVTAINRGYKEGVESLAADALKV